jgi:group I intron endonuclease
MNENKDKIVVGHIYVFLFPNGKRYVGQTIRSVKGRVYKHFDDTKRGCQLPVHNAMRKYGRENIKIEKIFLLKCTQEYLDLIEDKAIIKFNTLVPNGYNLKRGGSYGAHSEESKVKMSAVKRGQGKGKHVSKETRAKISAARKGKPGRPQSEQAKAKVSAARKGRHLSEETKAKLSIINKGKTLSNETKTKMSAAKKRNPLSKEIRARLSALYKGKPRTEESIIKRTATRRRNNSGHYHKQGYKPRPWLRGKSLSEETIAKRTATRKMNASLKKLK